MKTYLILPILAIILGTSCTYRFSNQYLTPPNNAQTILIESAFDTSAHALNHQFLTRAFENAVAKDGKLLLTRKKNADLYLRLNLSNVTRNQYDVGLTNATSDPEISADAPKISEFADMKTPKKFANKERLSLTVNVEFWDLHKKKKVFAKSYTLYEAYPILDTNTERENRYLRYREKMNVHFASISKRIAESALLDFYRG